MTPVKPIDMLRQYWGHQQFRPLQEEIILSALQGNDTLALLPTGGGKSICYQIPALCREGICIVISPLIALMKDQVDNLKQRGIPAAAIYAGMNQRAIDITFENACNGAYKLLYLSPERLFTDMARARLPRMNISLVAVDEAHCISQWGYDFRPPYLEIASLRPLWGEKIPILALTATATEDVVLDIQEKLGFPQQQVFRQRFVRENLSYSVLYEAKKRDKMLHVLRSVPGTAIVYLRSRGETKDIAKWLVEHNISAAFYHAGLTMEERSSRQTAWMNGKIRVMVCTNAFGMGIDKPDVRVVVHLMLPDNLESYFQEAGRAGRDGKKAYAVLMYSEGDADNLRRQLDASFPDLAFIKRVYQALGSHTQLAVGAGAGESYAFDLLHFCQTYKLEQPRTHAALRLLEQEGWIAVSESAAAPARVQIIAERERLYDYQLRNRQADLLTKAMLRAFPGVQQDLVAISEASLAKLCKSNLASVIQVLQAAHQEGILEYQPATDKPQLTFLKDRATADQLHIDLEKLRFRRERATIRVEEAIRYAVTKRCRSRQLVAYFGDKNSENCGICDVCTGRNESDLPADLYDSLSGKIRQVLKDGPLSVEEILSAFANKRHAQITQVLQYMLDEGLLEEDDDQIRIA